MAEIKPTTIRIAPPLKARIEVYARGCDPPLTVSTAISSLTGEALDSREHDARPRSVSRGTTAPSTLNGGGSDQEPVDPKQAFAAERAWYDARVAPDDRTQKLVEHLRVTSLALQAAGVRRASPDYFCGLGKILTEAGLKGAGPGDRTDPAVSSSETSSNGAGRADSPETKMEPVPQPTDAQWADVDRILALEMGGLHRNEARLLGDYFPWFVLAEDAKGRFERLVADILSRHRVARGTSQVYLAELEAAIASCPVALDRVDEERERRADQAPGIVSPGIHNR
jgi:hypothetical protein